MHTDFEVLQIGVEELLEARTLHLDSRRLALVSCPVHLPEGSRSDGRSSESDSEGQRSSERAGSARLPEGSRSDGRGLEAVEELRDGLAELSLDDLDGAIAAEARHVVLQVLEHIDVPGRAGGDGQRSARERERERAAA